MQDLYDFLIKLGPGWMSFILVGTIGGAIAYLVSHRQYLKMLRAGHEEQIKLKDETIAMLNEAKATAIVTLEAAKNDAVKDRDNYRDRLHEEKAHHQSTLLRLTELESRPDLTQILKVQRDFNQDNVGVQQKMLDLLTKLEKKIDEEHQVNTELCVKTGKALDGLVKMLVAKGVIEPLN